MQISPDEIQALRTMLEGGSGKPLIPPAKFGTDGIRGILGRDFTLDLFRAAAKAVGQHLNESPHSGKSGILIGHDTRFLGRTFALVVAYELARMGHRVLVTSTFCATPVLAHYVWRNNLAAGIMLTASHNPPEYQGFKFIPYFGGPAMPEDTDRLGEILATITKSGDNFGKYEQDVLENIDIVDPLPGYLKHLSEKVDFDAINLSGLRVGYDPMYGCGQGCFDRALLEKGFPEANLKVIHNNVDPLFGGSLPEPKAALLKPLVDLVASGCDVGFATDGDADRFAAIDTSGRFFSPNDLLFILADHLIENRGFKGDIARTVATTGLLDKVAKAHGREVIETAVGFKYISEAIRSGRAFMGGEESGGFSSDAWVPEKDGIYACLMAMEALVYSKGKSLSGLIDKLYKKYGRLVATRIDLHVSGDEKDVLMKKATGLDGPFLGETPSGRTTIDGVKLSMPGGASLLLRPSGTEPLIRCYLEASDETSLSTLEAEVKHALGM